MVSEGENKYFMFSKVVIRSDIVAGSADDSCELSARQQQINSTDLTVGCRVTLTEKITSQPQHAVAFCLTPRGLLALCNKKITLYYRPTVCIRGKIEMTSFVSQTVEKLFNSNSVN